MPWMDTRGKGGKKVSRHGCRRSKTKMQQEKDPPILQMYIYIEIAGQMITNHASEESFCQIPSRFSAALGHGVRTF